MWAISSTAPADASILAGRSLDASRSRPQYTDERDLCPALLTGIGGLLGRGFLPRPRRTGGRFAPPVSASVVGWRCTDGSSGLLPDLCSRGVRPSLLLTEGAGGFFPGMLLGARRN